MFITWGRRLLPSLESGCNFTGDTTVAIESSPRPETKNIRERVNEEVPGRAYPGLRERA